MNAEGGGLLPIRSWTDVAALGTLLVMALAGLAWGLKLDQRTDILRTDMAGDEQRISKIETTLASGAMAAAQTRLIEQQREIDVLYAEIRDLEHTSRVK